ncbi:MAG: trypsin-like peptidase domain-containing protein [Candidatus Binatia bacterium]
MAKKSLIGLILLALIACQRAEPPQSKPESPPAPPPRLDRDSTPAGSYAPIVERVAPSVVTIRSARRLRAPRQFPFSNDPRLGELFGGLFGAPGGREQIRTGLGSGVIVRADGYVLTNHHVIDGADEITIELLNRRSFSAKIVGSDPPSDLAVLKVEASDLPALALGNSDETRVGDIVLALGNPLGIGQTVTAGIISAKSRSTGLSDGSFEDFLQTDASINQGNSGGALVNSAGLLVGINSQILSPTGVNIGIGFAVPVNMARNVMDQLISNGKVERGQLGIGIQPMTPEIAASIGLKETGGVIINEVRPNSAASRAGLRRGDVVVAFNGAPVVDGNALRNAIAGSKPGTAVKLTILRDGAEQTIEAKLDEYRAESAPARRER